MIDLNWRPGCLQVIRDARTNTLISRYVLMFQGYFITLVGGWREEFLNPANNDNG